MVLTLSRRPFGLDDSSCQMVPKSLADRTPLRLTEARLWPPSADRPSLPTGEPFPCGSQPERQLMSFDDLVDGVDSTDSIVHHSCLGTQSPGVFGGQIGHPIGPEEVLFQG